MEKNIKIEDVDVNMKARQTNDEFVFYNPLKCKKLVVEGLPFFSKENNYYRVPKNYKDKVTDAVFWLAGMPSGGQIRFKTNSKKIIVRLKNFGDYQMCHMASTGQQGVDLYYRVKGEKEYKFFTCSKFPFPSIDIKDTLFDADNKQDKEIIINLPLYEGLESIEIGIEQDAYLKKPKKHKKEGRVVVYGTSVTQGGCASRPGMSWTNILSRKLDVEFVNLGFSGSGLGEKELAELITTIDNVSLLVLDYEANGGATGDMEHNLEQFIDILRSKFKEVPLVVVSKHIFAVDIYKEKDMERRRFYYHFQKDMVDKKKSQGDNNIYFIDGSLLYGKKDIFEMTVDGLHPTDLGFYMIAKYLEPIFRKLLKK